MFAYSQCTVPLVTVITRKAFGGAYDVMASKHVGGDLNYAWPTAQIAVMGAKGAVEIIFRADIGDKDKIAARTKEYEDRFLSPFVAAERGYIDDVIMPHSTRRRLARALAMLKNKHVEMPARKHDNLPSRAGRGASSRLTLGQHPIGQGGTHSPDEIHLHGARHQLHVRHRADVVKTVTNEVVTAEELGGARCTHQVGRSDGAFENDVECLLRMRRLIDFLPANNESGVPEWPTQDPDDRIDELLDTLMPGNPNKPYDIKELILKVVDEGDFFEISTAYAKNIVTGFGRIAVRTAGFVANQPMVLAGVLDSDARARLRASCASATP